MLFDFLQGLLSRCVVSIATLIRRWISGAASIKPSSDLERGVKDDGTPVESEEDETPSRKAKQEFIKSISHDAVKALASRYNNGKPCEIFGEDNGSFNACFFVHFPDDDARWVVRVPIESALQQPWEKLQSEVATVKYLKSATAIPVPSIRAYGKGETLTSDKTTTQMFLISDYIPGKPLTLPTAVKCPQLVRSRLLQDIFDILLELRKVEFDTIGSLMPGKSDAEPVVGNLLTFSSNELPGVRLPTFATAQEYMKSQFDLVLQHTGLPLEGFKESAARRELFAAYSLQKYFTVPDVDNNGPFVLHHADMRLGNIIVNDDLEIQGVIDWEFANIVPLQFFVPPPWATEERGFLPMWFRLEMLEAMGTTDRYEPLRQAWDKSNTDRLRIARIMRYPSTISPVFQRFFAKALFGDDVDEAEKDFFEANVALASEARRRAMVYDMD